MPDRVKLTERQMDHLQHLKDGHLHFVVKLATSRSCFDALVTKGLAERVFERHTYHKTKYRITDSGRALLASNAKGE